VAQGTPNTAYSEIWQALDGLKALRRYDNGTPVFHQGDPAQGIYLVEKGEVRLMLPGSALPQPTFAVAGPGAVLGLSETMTGQAHKLGAEALGPAEIAFVEREALLEFLRLHHQFCLQIVRLLSDDLHALYQRFQGMSAEGKSRRRASPVAVN
jgi:CRP-like cAMP-binding protein